MANQYTKQKENNRKEIIWNLVNSGLAAGLVFLGACANGNLSWRGVVAALIAAGIVAFTKFKDYWSKEEHEYISKTFQFLH